MKTHLPDSAQIILCSHSQRQQELCNAKRKQHLSPLPPNQEPLTTPHCLLLQKQKLPVLISHFPCFHFTSNNSHMGSSEEPVGMLLGAKLKQQHREGLWGYMQLWHHGY